jgi:hypothetical protein
LISPWAVKDVSHDDNRNVTLHLKPDGQKKNIAAHERVSSDLAISRHEAPIGVYRWSLQKLDTPARLMRAGINQTLILAREET